MKRSIILPGLVTVFVSLSPAAVAVAAPPTNPGNPSGTGQPNQSAEEQPLRPPGFFTDGFANAETHYAAGTDQGKNPKAVSQYDVAAFQVSQTHTSFPNQP
jgi:hypothetical protein